MPKGWLRLSAKVDVCFGLPLASTPRKTIIWFEELRATNKSPFGAVRISLGCFTSPAYSSTLKPAGAFGHASSGRFVGGGPLSTLFVANGAGRSATVSFLRTPG